MVTRFDHVVIGVRDLDTAIRRYQDLGFDVKVGGKHTGRGTHNALIRFGLDYVELLAVYDEDEVRASRPGGEEFLALLKSREELLLGYALATENIEEEAERFRGSDLFVQEPFAMQRTRPDGYRLTWHLFLPGGSSWRQRWPFLIQWDAPDEQRLEWEQPGMHPNSAAAWVRVAVAVRDLQQAIPLYRDQLGLPFQRHDTIAYLHAQRANFTLGTKQIDLLFANGPGPVQQTLEEIGEGPIEVSFAVKSLAQARAFLNQKRVAFEENIARPGELLITPQDPLAVRIALVKQA